MFVISAIPKIQRPYDFLENVRAYRIVSFYVEIVIAAGLPFVELVIGIALLSSVLLRSSLAIACLLLALFAYLQVYAMVHHLQIGCGCFSVGTNLKPEEIVGFATLSRTLFAMMCALITLLISFMRGRHYDAINAISKVA
jgi:hypothetical protein